ncbi:hypothetical protein Tco_0544227 [Tanacetum coccineum]
MSITKEQQQALDDALVLREQRLQIGSCNYILSTTFKPKEPTFQVDLDVLSLTPFYPAFLITTSVLAIYMHEFWTSASYHKHSIRFKLNTKRYSFDLDNFRNMLNIFPKLPGQQFVDPPFEEEILTFMRELGYPGNIKLLSDVKVDILPQPWRTFGTIISKCISVTGKAIPKPKYVRQTTKEKIIQAPKASSGKRIKSATKVTKSGKKKQPTQGLETLSEIALSKAEQMKITLERSMTQQHSSHASGSSTYEGIGVKPGVPDVPTYGSDDEQISWKSNEEEDDNEVVVNDDDDDNNDDDNTDIHYSIKQINLLRQFLRFPALLMQFLNKLDDNIKKIIKDQVKEQVKAQVSKILSKIKKTVNEQLKAEVLTRSSNEFKTSHAVAANLSELELKKILIDKMESNKSIHRSDEQKNLYKALVNAYKSDKLIHDTYRDTVLFKRRRDDEDKDEEPSAGSNWGSKRIRAGKEPESTSAPKEKTSKTTGKSTKGSKSHHESAGESAQVEEPMHTTKDLEEPAHHEFEIGVTKDQPNEETSQLPD